MTIVTNEQQRYERCRKRLEAHSQLHLLKWWEELTHEQRTQLLNEIESISWEVLERVVDSHVRHKPHRSTPTNTEPVVVYPHVPEAGQEKLYAEARKLGDQLLRSGKIAAFTVAGGQGTRLGIDGPKGAVVVTPVGEKTLFELFAHMCLAARRRYGVAIPWYIMTSPANHDQTVSFLQSHDYFGLPAEDVLAFPQGMLPAFHQDGRIVLADKHRLALAPDGHGGCFAALENGGALKDMRRRGVEIISYFQVDNPLVKPFDPLFLGLHAKTGSQMSTKVTTKADDLECVGNVCLVDGKVTVIEYSELPEVLAHQRNADGLRKFDAGNLAIHAMDVSFIEQLVHGELQLPFRRADKAVEYIDDAGHRQEPESPNTVKLEKFVFDVLPLAANALVFEVNRSEEFSPVKNVSGVDSPETSHRDQIARACRWLELAGINVPLKPDGTPDVTVVISPLFALAADDLKAKASSIEALRPGEKRYLE